MKKIILFITILLSFFLVWNLVSTTNATWTCDATVINWWTVYTDCWFDWKTFISGADVNISWDWPSPLIKDVKSTNPQYWLWSNQYVYCPWQWSLNSSDWFWISTCSATPAIIWTITFSDVKSDWFTFSWIDKLKMKQTYYYSIIDKTHNQTILDWAYEVWTSSYNTKTWKYPRTLQPSTKYEVTVEWSSHGKWVWEITTTNAAPVVIPTISISNVKSNQFTFSWTNTGWGSVYLNAYEYTSDWKYVSTLFSWKQNQTSPYTVSNLKPDTNYKIEAEINWTKYYKYVKTSMDVAQTKETTCWWSIVANASATTWTTYTQTLNWSTWSPTINWWENQTTCDFNCNAGYSWDWDSCETETSSTKMSWSMQAKIDNLVTKFHEKIMSSYSTTADRLVIVAWIVLKFELLGDKYPDYKYIIDYLVDAINGKDY